jgi:prolipoprotein diacylglyceryltransferase
LAEDDFVVLRKNITTEKIFNLTIAMGFIGLLSARLFYVLFNPRPVFFEVLGFLLFPYFPGLSLIGGILGAVIFYAVASKRAGFPVERVFDFIAKSFLAAAPFGTLGVIVLSLKLTPPLIFNLVAYTILLFLAIFFSKRGEKLLREGSFGLISLFLVSAIWIVTSFLTSGFEIKNIWYKENFIALIMLVASLILLLKNEVTRLINGR